MIRSTIVLSTLALFAAPAGATDWGALFCQNDCGTFKGTAPSAAPQNGLYVDVTSGKIVVANPGAPQFAPGQFGYVGGSQSAPVVVPPTSGVPSPGKIGAGMPSPVLPPQSQSVPKTGDAPATIKELAPTPAPDVVKTPAPTAEDQDRLAGLASIVAAKNDLSALAKSGLGRPDYAGIDQRAEALFQAVRLEEAQVNGKTVHRPARGMATTALADTMKKMGALRVEVKALIKAQARAKALRAKLKAMRASDDRDAILDKLNQAEEAMSEGRKKADVTELALAALEDAAAKLKP